MREPIPIACSLSAEDRAGRDGEFAAILGRGLLAREDTVSGIRLRFRRSPSLEEDLADLTRREKECCPFLDFRIEASGDELLLEVSTPPDARPIVEQLFALEGR
jgi:MerR family transcriptional regulator, copper efflux regulator